MLDSAEWTSFTRIPLKARLYDRETYFREGLADALETWGNEAAAILRRAALLLVKPDGLLCGKASVVVRFLAANEFSIVAVELPLFTRFHWRELWRYQLTSATLDRLAVNDLVLRDRSLLLLLRDNGNLDVPAAVWLSGRKGPSDVARQPVGCLRRDLAQPNRILSFVHVADEPADVLRELAIMLDRPARRRVLEAFPAGAISPADQDVLNRVLAESDRNAATFDTDAALGRAKDALRRTARQQPSVGAAADRVLADLERMRRGERIPWRPFARAVSQTGVHLDRWDLATLGSAFIVYDEPGTSKQVEAVDARLWTQNPAQGAPIP